MMFAVLIWWILRPAVSGKTTRRDRMDRRLERLEGGRLLSCPPSAVPAYPARPPIPPFRPLNRTYGRSVGSAAGEGALASPVNDQLD
jgi:hypothetical protein